MGKVIRKPVPRKPVLTQRMFMHLNGGSKFSELHFRIYADGIDTGITRHKRTGGKPSYLVTHDIFKRGEEEFDNLAAKGVGAEEWIMERVPKPDETKGAGG